MAEKKKQKSTIGARQLSEAEIKLILPTYDRIYEQIDKIREECKEKKDSSEDKTQRINNIGIMGHRGTGKTSVLKTIAKTLEEQNRESEKKKNIVLPMIVPENMSPSMNLMSTILGLFKNIIDKIEKDGKQVNCWEKSNSCKDKYDELIKKYCFVQETYRDILVKTYSTENEYIRNSASVFNSDIEFLRCLNEFIEQLLKHKDYCADDAMIFLFIDDIDLSTNRCVDVVKTLLSYISNPRIITFISGDLNTFEEALTLDFLRQEHALKNNILDVKIKEETLLEGRKTLAYEYLKKIIPPVYRHTVKNWSIDERGNYLITGSEDEPKTLGDILEETFANDTYNCKGFFKYVKESSWGANDFTKKNLPEVFHMFDNTSRGLNNIYSVLLTEQDTLCAYAGNHTDENEKAALAALKVVIESMIASNKVLSDERQFLLEELVHFGDTFATTEIKAENIEAYIERNYGISNNYEKNEIEKNPVKYYSVLIFIEFLIRILKQERNEKGFTILHIFISDMLLTYPQISGKIASDDDIAERLIFDDNSIRKYRKNTFEIIVYLQMLQFVSRDELRKTLDFQIQKIDDTVYAESINIIISLEGLYGLGSISKLLNNYFKSLVGYKVVSTDEKAELYEKKLKLEEYIEKSINDDSLKNYISENPCLWTNYISDKMNKYRDKEETSVKAKNKKRLEIIEYINKCNGWENEEVLEIYEKIIKEKSRIFKSENIQNFDLVKLSDEFWQTFNEIKNKRVTRGIGGYDYLMDEMKKILPEGKKKLLTLREYSAMIGSKTDKITLGKIRNEGGKMTIWGFLQNRYYRGADDVRRLFVTLNQSVFESLPLDLCDENLAWLECYLAMDDKQGENRRMLEQSKKMASLAKKLNEILLMQHDEAQDSIFQSYSFPVEEVFGLFE